jgi:creatinine deaminase
MGIPDDLARRWLAAALEEARVGWSAGGIPIGSVIGDPRTGEVVARGHNQRVQHGDPTAHGEMSAIRNAGRRRDWHELVLVTTLSPCPMCAGTAVLLNFAEVIIGEDTTFQGAESWLHEAGIKTTVVGCGDCIDLMEKMQRERADLWAEDIGK